MPIFGKNGLLLLVALIACFLPQIARSESGSLREFLLSTPGTYGWQPLQGTIMYDFLEDGRLAVQGPDGEATMWEGRWILKGDRITLVVPDLKFKQTFTAKADGKQLLLDQQSYKRYKP